MAQDVENEELNYLINPITEGGNCEYIGNCFNEGIWSNEKMIARFPSEECKEMA